MEKLEDIGLQTYRQFFKHTGRTKDANPANPECNSKVKISNGSSNSSLIKTEYDKYEPEFLKDKEKRKTVLSALSPIIPVRRISSLPDNMEEGNYVRAAGLLGIAAIFLPEDYRDVRDGIRQLRGKFKPSYDFKEFQQPFSYFKGTLLEPVLKLKGKWGSRIAEKLQSWDISLYQTKYGQFLRKIFNVELDKSINTGRTYGRDKQLWVHNFKGNAIQKLIGRSLLRIPYLSAVTLAVLEIPALVKSFNSGKDAQEKTKNTSKQLLKSSVFVTSILTGIGLAGAYLAKKGPAGSLLGMGIGAVAGSGVSSLVNKQIDKI